MEYTPHLVVAAIVEQRHTQAGRYGVVPSLTLQNSYSGAILPLPPHHKNLSLTWPVDMLHRRFLHVSMKRRDWPHCLVVRRYGLGWEKNVSEPLGRKGEGIIVVIIRLI